MGNHGQGATGKAEPDILPVIITPHMNNYSQRAHKLYGSGSEDISAAGWAEESPTSELYGTLSHVA